MGEFTIQCTVCDGTFGGELEYNDHKCTDQETKESVKIKEEPRDSEEEKDALLDLNHIEFESDTINIKNEPFDLIEPTSMDDGEEDSRRDSDMEDPLSIVCNTEENVENEEGDGTHNEYLKISTENQNENNIPSKESDKEPPNMDKKFPFTYTKDLAFRCKLCHIVFTAKDKFTKHFKQNHKNYRPYECGVCGKSFLHKHYVNLHMRVHTGEKPYVCKLCPRSYSHKTSFTIHMRIHNGERPYACELCGKKCYDKSGLTSHMRSHTKETPYQCEVCGRRFTHSKSLLVHRRNHTGEKPYVCSYCGKAFRHWHKHKIHVRLHTGERPYKCKVCGKGFPRNDEVSRHMRSHQGIKSFKCSICGVYCATQASITGHINLHHFNLKIEGIEPPPEKTLVKDSTSGILGTKTPEPRSLYRLGNKKKPPPVVTNKALSKQSLAEKLSCRVIEVTSKDTPITIPTSAKKGKDKKIKCILPKPKTSLSNDKAMSYQEFLNWQERMLTNQGLIVKGYPSTSNKDRTNSTSTSTSSSSTTTTTTTNTTTTTSTTTITANTTEASKFTVKSISDEKTKPWSSVPIPSTSGNATKPQYILLSQGGERNGTKILLPLNMIDQPTNSASAREVPTMNLPTLVAPNVPQTMGLPGHKPMFFSVGSQPLLFVSNGGQRMVFMTSPTVNNKSAEEENMLMDQPAIKSEPDSLFQPELTIKTEIDETLATSSLIADSAQFQIKEEPQSDDELQ